ncbi:hypothetical protein [Candidatus Albibeggiatoa sp. nov. NOAA]|uniref:hypothetical protein n=1 Tax=Candidatus Albibeggiatoa sp. nov. NOAA TaxID=3162724 RepID=UPI0032F28539|nr:hypothetical protein [Thiotrichaceae bacterium]
MPEQLIGNNHFFIQDDLFYYLEIAKNFWIHYTFTFDEISQTNGFHPLWQWLLILLYGVSDTLNLEEYFLYASILLNAALFLASALLFYHILNRIFSKTYSFVFSYLSYLLAMPFLINGMETILVVFFFEIYILYFLRISKPNPKENHLFLNALIIILISLSRLDAIIISLLLLVLNSLYFNKAYLIRLVFIYCFFMSAFFALNYLFFGTILPISGEVKQFWATQTNDNFSTKITYLMKLFSKYASQPFSFYLNTYKQVILEIAIAGIFLFFIKISIYSSIKKINPNSVQYKYVAFNIIIILYTICQLIYYSIYSPLIWRWYLGTGLLLIFFNILYGLFYFRWLDKSFLKIGLLYFVIVLFLLDICHTQVTVNHIYNNETWGKVSLRVVDWIEQNTDESDIIGSWASGEIGFYSSRKIVNLEGLVGDVTILDANKTNTLFSYIKQKNIKYLIQWFPASAFDKKRQCMQKHGNPLVNLRLKVLYNNCKFLQLVDILDAKDKNYRVFIFKVIK